MVLQLRYLPVPQRRRCDSRTSSRCISRVVDETELSANAWRLEMRNGTVKHYYVVLTL